MRSARFAHWQVYDNDGRRKYQNDAERRRLLAVADTLPDDRRTFCHVLALTGCRVSEALELTRDRLDTERCALAFRTLKRRRTVFRVVPIPKELCSMLLALPRVSGGRFWQMHRTTAWRLVHSIAEGVGVVGPMASCRGLRHGFGIHAASRNVPPSLIQRWMGHASLTTTTVYLDAVGQEEREFAERMW